jgi:hypothetical protein
MPSWRRGSPGQAVIMYGSAVITAGTAMRMYGRRADGNSRPARMQYGWRRVTCIGTVGTSSSRGAGGNEEERRQRAAPAARCGGGTGSGGSYQPLGLRQPFRRIDETAHLPACVPQHGVHAGHPVNHRRVGHVRIHLQFVIPRDVAEPGTLVPSPSDFNGDGKPDLVGLGR